MKVVHLITSLEHGGAQGVLKALASSVIPGVEQSVVAMTSTGPYAEQLQNCDVKVACIGMSRGLPSLSSIVALWRLLRAEQPDILHTWMYHADLLGSLISLTGGPKRVAWNIRHSVLNAEYDCARTRFIVRLCALLSHRLPVGVTFCSQEGARVHSEIGYAPTRMHIIPNGVDVKRFRPDAQQRESTRGMLGLDENEVAIGMVGRWNGAKDHRNFFRALTRIDRTRQKCRLVLVGPEMESSNSVLVRELYDFGLLQDACLLGARTDIPAIMGALDLHVLSSRSEAFPNVVAEAMACGTPCVTTAVGDAADIVGDAGWVVPAQDGAALAKAIESALAILRIGGRNAVGELGRQRILQHYSLPRMVSSYHAFWQSLVFEPRVNTHEVIPEGGYREGDVGT